MNGRNNVRRAPKANLAVMADLQKTMKISGIACSSALDTSFESIDIQSMDISSLKDGTAVINWEHKQASDKDSSPNDILGAITYAHKILSADDCENDRQLMYWNSVQLPLVYIEAELFDGEGHAGAKAAAAMIRYYHRRKLPLVSRFSIEGSTLFRDGHVLKRTAARSCALTLRPANRSCITGVISDSETPETIDPLKGLEESTVKFENPNRRKLASHESTINPMIDDYNPLQKMQEAIEDLREINSLQKALSIGGGDVRPSGMSGGGALQAENFSNEKKKKFIKNQALAAVRDWRGRGDLTKFLKARLPDASDEFVQHFARLVDDIHLKKAQELENNLIKAIASTPTAPKAATTPATHTKATEPKADAKRQPTANPKWVHDKERQVSVQASSPRGLEIRGLPAASMPSVKSITSGKEDNEALTIRGRKIRPTKHTEPHFDERTGTLHTPRGNFKMYLPQNDPHPGAYEAFHNALNDPKATASHDYAINNWFKVHELLKAGRLPPEVIMHSVLFSQLSPNTPVSSQELMFSRLQDSMNATGIDARSPAFSGIKDDWLSRDKPKELPVHSREHFVTGPGRGVRLLHPSKTSGREAGDIGSYMLANNKFDNMKQYHTLHNSLMQLFAHHKENGRAAVAELMAHKNKAGLWSDQRQRQIDKGQPDPGEYQGPNVPGLAPKTGRYMAGMLGAGNSHVPDTHFIRYLFGLEKGPDSNSIAYLKNVMWNEKNSHVLDGIDRYYANNHPAVQHMMDHPTFGKRFATREDAVFPAFWKNWAAIVPHERARGMKTGGFNELTDHRPYWDAINPFVNKSESDIHDLLTRTAELHAEWVEKYGEIPAQMMYFTHIVPQLLRASRQAETPIQKMELLATSLRKAAAAMAHLPALNHDTPPEVQEFKGKKVIPGEIEVASGPYQGSKMHFVGSGNEHHFVRPQNSESNTLLSLPKKDAGTGYKILRHPQNFKDQLLVDANRDAFPGLNNLHSQKELMHGIDILNPYRIGTTGITALEAPGDTGWFKNISNKSGYVKPDVNNPKFWSHYTRDIEDPEDLDAQEYLKAQTSYSLPHREVLFHNLAHDFFGVGQHVPPTAIFNHPKTGQPMSVMERTPGDVSHFDGDNDNHGATLHALHNNGTLDKLAMTDLFMGNQDRNAGNYLLSTQAPGVHLIDNGLSLDYAAPLWKNFMYVHHHGSSPDKVAPDIAEGKVSQGSNREIHPQTVDWMLGLKPEEFERQLNNHGVPRRLVKEGVERMKVMQAHAMISRAAGQPITRGSIYDAVRQHMVSKL